MYIQDDATKEVIEVADGTTIEAGFTEVADAAGAALTVVAKRDKKLTKSIEGTVVTIEAVGGTKGAITFDAAELSEEICQKLIPFAISHKLGDAAAGRTGEDAEKAITAVWEGLLKGEWTVRQAAAPKVNVSQVKETLANMSDADREKAQALLSSMGFKF